MSTAQEQGRLRGLDIRPIIEYCKSLKRRHHVRAVRVRRETKKLLDVTVAKNGKGVEEAVGGSDNQIL